MLFNSFEFLVFFPLVVMAYFAMPARYRWTLLLAASYLFYAAWKVEYLALIIASTLVDFWAGRQMARRDGPSARRPFLLVSLGLNLGLLGTFKYFNFFSESFRAASAYLNEAVGLPDLFADSLVLEVLLPVGISFYTFQTLSYTIDVYRGKKEAETHLGLFALYVSFFPQLVAGPIERSTQLMPQFRAEQQGVGHGFDYARVRSGLTLMLWGFFKKLVIADRLAIYVQEVYGAPGAYEGLPVLLATYFFTIQIYCDFSGYSDIAIGAARVMGYDLMENFRRPYFSKSIGEFWRRWHISLSTWFKDYVYIPLGGNRVARWRWYVNLLIVFTVSGLWHGANWTFVLWGALHGVYLVVSLVTQPMRDGLWNGLARAWPAGSSAAAPRTAGWGLPSVRRLRDFVGIVVTFNLIAAAFIMFRSASLGDAAVMAESLLQGGGGLLVAGFGSGDFLLAVGSIVFMELVHLWERSARLEDQLARLAWPLRWAFYYVLLGGIALFGVFEAQAFIYFQF